MAQLSRILQRIFGQDGTQTDFGQIGSQAAGAPQTTKDLSTIQSLQQYLDGLTAITANQGGTILPYLEDINSILLLVTSQLAYHFQNGIPEWLDDANQRYYANVSFVSRNGIIYRALLGDDGPNINSKQDPALEPTWWTPIAGVANVNIAPGTIIDFGGTVAPAGYLECNGDPVSRTTFENLFIAIGTTWGVGDGSTTFNVPDLRGAFTRGTGNHGSETMADGNPFAGPTIGTFEDDQMQGHWHQQFLDSGGSSGLVAALGAASNPDGEATGTGVNASNQNPNTDGVNGPPRTGDETRPFAAGVLKCIKT